MRAAIVIGVDKAASELQTLTAAASGARDVARWLGRNDYSCQLFTDANGTVQRHDILNAIHGLTETSKYERLLVYFAGHGILKAPGDEYWLLSNADIDDAQAINVTASSVLARTKGVPEIIFISDACRVLTNSLELAPVNGGSIFPRGKELGQGAEIDIYYGTHPGDPSYELADKDSRKAHGLFTRELLDAHKGAPSDALLSIDGRDYVRSRWLKAELPQRVDASAQRISLKYSQKPSVQLETYDSYIAENEAGIPDSPGQRPPLLERFTKSRPNYRKASGPGARPATGTEVEGAGDPAMSVDALLMRRVIDIMPDRPSLDVALVPIAAPGELLSCRGGAIEEIAVPRQLSSQRADAPGHKRIFGFDLTSDAVQIGVRFDDGSGMLLPILRDYDCEIVRDEEQTIAVAYTWRGTMGEDLTKLRSEVVAAATLGLLSRDREKIEDVASRIRQAKRYDPVLGIVSALAYASIGNFDGARSVRGYMRDDLGIDLFDSWLLGGAADGNPVFPSVPLLAQTWSFLEVFEQSVPEELRGISRVPGFWTVFDRASMDTVMRFSENTEQAGEPMYE